MHHDFQAHIMQNNGQYGQFLLKTLPLNWSSYWDNAIRSPSSTSPNVKLLCSICT